MGSVTQKSRSCVPLLLSLTPSVLPPLLISVLPALIISAWPVRSLSVLTTAVGDANISTVPSSLTTPAMRESTAYSVGPKSSSSVETVYPSKSTSATSLASWSLFTSSLSGETKTVSPQFRGRVSRSINRVHSHPLFPFKPLKQTSSRSSSLLPRPCDCQTLARKTIGPPLRENLACHFSRMTRCHESSDKLYARLFPLSSSTWPPKGLPPSSRPHTPPRKLPAPASPLPLALLPFTSKVPPTPFSKASSIPSAKTSPSPARVASPSRRPGPPSLRHTTGPLFEHQPFIVTWNIPDLVCNRYNIPLDTSPFKGVTTPAKVPGQFLSLFYTDRLGLYPHVDLSGRNQFNGGIPQRSDLKASMSKARADINYYITSRTSQGLAVIDWEEWRPLWDRNWGIKRIYQTLSVSHVLQANRSLTEQEATEKAKLEFQVAARNFMLGKLELGRTMRPNYLWGFYLFPNCYNYGWERADYTGQCSAEVKSQNDELLWLWESSTALYPSVYLQVSLADNPRAALMVRNRVQEALRVSALPRRSGGGAAPVFVYTRPVFVDQNRRFLSQGDLMRTIGESAAVGASGAVLWGASADYDDQTSCEALSSYLSSTLNPYVTNVTVAAQLCSNFLCRGNGRCVRKNYDSDHYLHLNPENFRILHVQSRYLVLGKPTLTDLKTLSRRFTCQCYEGLNCSPRTYKELAKALMFSMKKGLYHKTHTLNKAMLDDVQQDRFTEDNNKIT